MSFNLSEAKLWQSEVARVSAILAGLLTLCFYPVIFGNKTLMLGAQESQSILSTGAYAGHRIAHLTFSRTLDPGAPAWVTEPHLALDGYQYKHEKVAPLWNPYQGYGRPLAANMSSQPFSPIALPFILHPTPRTYNLFVILRLFLAGLGGFLFIRNFVSFGPAVAGAIATAFGGYYIVFVLMHHLSVEIMLPWALAGVELVFRRPSYKSFLFFTAVSVLIFLGGMPETAALILLFVALYLTFRFLTESALRSHWLRWYLTFGSAVVAAAGLCAFFLLPSFEFVQNSFNAHEIRHVGSYTGLVHDTFNQSIFTYLFPLLFGPPVTSAFPGVFNGLRNYIGLIPLSIALVALVPLFRWRDEVRRLNWLTLFFAATAFFVVLKRYGFAPLNPIGRLPVLNLIYFPKYDELLFSISIAVLCAIGLEHILQRTVAVSSLVKALALSLCAFPLAFLTSRTIVWRVVETLHIPSHFAKLAIAVPLALVFSALVAALLYGNVKGTAPLRRLTTVLTVLMTAELLGNYVLPSYYWFEGIAYIEKNPYKGAPFIDYLKARTTNQERIFGRDFVLHPSWASPFQLNDIRDLDALYYSKYFPFLDAFLNGPLGALNTDLGDRFRGEGELRFDTPLERRLLQLSSVKFIATQRAFEAPNDFVAVALKQNAGRIEPGKEAYIRRVDLVVNGLGKTGLQEHPPYTRFPYQVAVPNGSDEKLSFSYTIDPAMWQGPGDGANFKLEVEGSNGSIEKVFENYIDPKHNPRERCWMNAVVDLTRYRGQSIRLLLSTDGGPKNDTAGDWADWAAFQFNNGPKTASEVTFKPVYAAEAQIFEYDDVLPRASLFYHADVVKDDTAALRQIVDPSFDIFSRVTINGSALTPQQRKDITELNEGASVKAEAANIRSYRSRDVTIEADTSRNALLMLNDSDYPGWAVTVDGKPNPILSADYLFRAVLLKPGKHTIEFTYNPGSWRAGLLISALTAALLVAAAFLPRGVLFPAPNPRVATPFGCET